MGMNFFIAVVCVVAAIVVTILAIRFFFDNAQTASDAPRGFGEAVTVKRSQAQINVLTRRVIISAILTLLVLIPLCVNLFADSLMPAWATTPWLQAILITPVMFYGGYRIHVSGWTALAHGTPTMNSLISIGSIASYAYSLFFCVAQSLFPESMREPYFEITGVLITLALFAQLATDIWLPRRYAFPLQTWVDHVSRIWVPLAILIALWTFVIWLVFGTQPSFARALLMAVSVLIIACPVALAWTAPLAVSNALENARRHTMLVRTISSLQTAQRTRCVVAHTSLVESLRQALQTAKHDDITVISADLHATQSAIDLIKQQESIVIVLGDGTEDIRVRESADIAMVCADKPLSGITDTDYIHADVVSGTHNGICVPELMQLSHSMMLTVKSNVVWAFIFNIIGVPLAAGVLYPFTGWILNPMIAGIAMVLSSLAVLLNAMRLRRVDLIR